VEIDIFIMLIIVKYPNISLLKILPNKTFLTY